MAMDNILRARSRLLEHLDTQCKALVGAIEPFNRERYSLALDEIERLARILTDLDTVVKSRTAD